MKSLTTTSKAKMKKNKKKVKFLVKKNGKTSKKHIVIETPCSVSDVEAFLHIISNEGHWHDAIVLGRNGNIIIEFNDDTL